MLSKIAAHARANLVAYLALFVALGGTSYAAATIGSNDIKDNAVLSRHVKDGTLRAQDLGPNSVGSGKVIDNSLQAVDLNPGSRTRKVEFRRGSTDETKRSVLKLGNLELSAKCHLGTNNATLLTIYVKNISKQTGTFNAGYIRWIENVTETQPFTDGLALGAGSEAAVNREGPPSENNIVNVDNIDPSGKVEGQIVMQTPGRVTTVNFHGYAFFSREKVTLSFCELFGTAASATT